MNTRTPARPADLSREQKTELIVQRSGQLLTRLPWARNLDCVRRFLAKQPDAELDRWFQLIGAGGAK